jgi:hypothetical protein
MSFTHTEAQIRARTKTVTRRSGWLNLKPGDLVRPVRKCRGLRPGEKIVPLGTPLRIVDVRRERLERLTLEPEYGRLELQREGFGEAPHQQSPAEFVASFCATHRPLVPGSVVTRIEFEFTEEADHGQVRQEGRREGQERDARAQGRHATKRPVA